MNPAGNLKVRTKNRSSESMQETMPERETELQVVLLGLARKKHRRGTGARNQDHTLAGEREAEHLCARVDERKLVWRQKRKQHRR
jgi:hypothetical protein